MPHMYQAYGTCSSGVLTIDEGRPPDERGARTDSGHMQSDPSAHPAGRGDRTTPDNKHRTGAASARLWPERRPAQAARWNGRRQRRAQTTEAPHSPLRLPMRSRNSRGLAPHAGGGSTRPRSCLVTRHPSIACHCPDEYGHPDLSWMRKGDPASQHKAVRDAIYQHARRARPRARRSPCRPGDAPDHAKGRNDAPSPIRRRDHRNVCPCPSTSTQAGSFGCERTEATAKHARAAVGPYHDVATAHQRPCAQNGTSFTPRWPSPPKGSGRRPEAVLRPIAAHAHRGMEDSTTFTSTANKISTTLARFAARRLRRLRPHEMSGSTPRETNATTKNNIMATESERASGHALVANVARVLHGQAHLPSRHGKLRRCERAGRRPCAMQLQARPRAVHRAWKKGRGSPNRSGPEGRRLADRPNALQRRRRRRLGGRGSARRVAEVTRSPPAHNRPMRRVARSVAIDPAPTKAPLMPSRTSLAAPPRPASRKGGAQ